MNGTTNDIAWLEEYSLGNAQIDSQHRRLFEWLNMLANACTDKTDTERLHETLLLTVNCAVRNFKDEEELLLRYSFPEFERHKRLHDIIKATMEGLIQKFSNNSSASDLYNDLSSVIVRWLVNHIKYEDRNFAECVRCSDS